MVKWNLPPRNNSLAAMHTEIQIPAQTQNKKQKEVKVNATRIEPISFVVDDAGELKKLRKKARKLLQKEKSETSVELERSKERMIETKSCNVSVSTICSDPTAEEIDLDFFGMIEEEDKLENAVASNDIQLHFVNEEQNGKEKKRSRLSFELSGDFDQDIKTQSLRRHDEMEQVNIRRQSRYFDETDGLLKCSVCRKAGHAWSNCPEKVILFDCFARIPGKDSV